MKNQVFFLLIICAIGGCQSNKQTDSEVIDKILSKTNDQILVCAHRANNSVNQPENSIAAISHCISKGIDIIELDVRTTSDDSLILMHDKTIDRTTTGTGRVNEKTYAELSQYHLRTKDTTTNQKIPTLHHALILAKGKDVILNLDLKEVDYPSLIGKLRKLDMLDKVMSFIGSESKVIEMNSLYPDYAILPLAPTIMKVNYYDSLLISPLIHLNKASFNAEVLDRTRQNNQISFMNILWREDKGLVNGDFSTLDKIIALKPNILQTDYPELLLSYLKINELHD